MGAESRVGAADGGGDALRSRVPWLLRYGCFRRLVGSKVLDAEALSGPRPRAPKGVKPTIPMASTVAAAGLRLARIAAGLHEEQKIVWSLFGSRPRFGAALQGAGSGTVLMDILSGAAHQSSIFIIELW